MGEILPTLPKLEIAWFQNVAVPCFWTFDDTVSLFGDKKAELFTLVFQKLKQPNKSSCRNRYLTFWKESHCFERLSHHLLGCLSVESPSRPRLLGMAAFQLHLQSGFVCSQTANKIASQHSDFPPTLDPFGLLHL